MESLSEGEVAAELGGHSHGGVGLWSRDSVDEGSLAVGGQEDPESGYLLLAGRLTRDFGDDLRHVSGLGWHSWDGRRWSQESGDVGALRAVHRVLVDAVYEAREAKNDALHAGAVRAMNSATGAEAVLRWARAMEPFAVQAADLDADGYLLNLGNGTLDLRDMTLRPHDRSQGVVGQDSAPFTV